MSLKKSMLAAGAAFILIFFGPAALAVEYVSHELGGDPHVTLGKLERTLTGKGVDVAMQGWVDYGYVARCLISRGCSLSSKYALEMDSLSAALRFMSTQSIASMSKDRQESISVSYQYPDGKDWAAARVEEKGEFQIVQVMLAKDKSISSLRLHLYFDASGRMLIKNWWAGSNHADMGPWDFHKKELIRYRGRERLSLAQAVAKFRQAHNLE